MNLTVNQEMYNTEMTDLKNSFAPFESVDGSPTSIGGILDVLNGTDMDATAYKTYYYQLINMSNLMNYYFGLLTANCNAIDNAVSAYVQCDSDGASSIGEN